MDTTQISKLLAYVLRHNPADIKLVLDSEGWTPISDLLSKLQIHKGAHVTREDLQLIVDKDKKGRYSIRDGKIRANQGHSIKTVNAIDQSPKVPPKILYHGTTEEKWMLIHNSGGLRKMNRHHVHLSADTDTAQSVAGRWKKRGERPIVLQVDALAMHSKGFKFFVSDNGVWLVDEVPLDFLRYG